MERHIYIVGFMGSGKSTIGPILAGEMDRPFYDLDELIEKEQERSISDIFESQGEAFYRQLESHKLFQSKHFMPCVMALGGGTFASKFNRDFISKHGLSVWLKIPIQLARERCRDSQHRPLAKDPARWESLFNLREPDYSLANIQVEVQGKSAQQICSEVHTQLTDMR
ncbi:MAG: shikimate kinase [Acidobacteriota bacterium]